MNSKDMVFNSRYNFKNQPEQLKYIGCNWSGNGFWHQFEKIGDDGVWCELQDDDLEMIEEAKEQSNDK